MNDKLTFYVFNYLQKWGQKQKVFGQRFITKKLIRKLLITVCLFSLMACQSVATAPIELAPDGNIIQQAIAQQLYQRLNPLSEQLKTNRPDVKIGQINVKNIESTVVAELPTYHLQGTYNLTLILPRQTINQKNNHFDVYLQRQAEGKTWRLLSKDNSTTSSDKQWKSYLISVKNEPET